MRAIALAVLFAGWPGVRAEVRTLTLKQALELALKESPEALLSRLDERRAEQRVRMAKDPFTPKLTAGSGLAYTSGFPMSIEGSAPSIVQTRAAASVYNLPQKYALAQAREEARTASLDAQGRRERAVSETIALFLDAERLGKAAAAAGTQIESAERTAHAVQARVQEGRELPVEGKRAALEIARARQRRDAFAGGAEQAEMSLAAALGMNPGDRARPAGEDRMPPELPADAEAAAAQALKDNREIRALESSLLAKSLQIKSYQAEKWPKLDLVAQYALFSRFNNYEDFFRRFERHNGQIGVSIQAPILLGPAASAQAAVAEAEAAKLRIGVNRARRRITLDARRAYQEVAKAESARQVARLDLDVAREDVSVALARMEEGRAALTHVEAARRVENEKWLAYLDANYSLERERFTLLERTGGLLALAGR